jgi:hypothetical protein
MADPVGLIGGGGGIDPSRFIRRPAQSPGDPASPSFKDTLLATRAVEQLQTGERQDVENVLLATTKADNAFRMLQSLRNRVMEAYDEIKQMRT